MSIVKKSYERREAKYDTLIKKQQSYMNNIIILKVLTFVLGAMCLIIAFSLRKSHIFFFIVLVIIIFITLLGNIYEKIENKKGYVTILYNINKASIDRLNGKWNLFKDTGKDFIDENHNYSYDLDIFGQNSLFQWINTCNTYMGRVRLKKLFTEAPKDEKSIYERQEAVEELASKIYFRQRLQAEGKRIFNNKQNLKELFSWMKEKNNTITNNKIIWMIRILSMITTILSSVLIIRIIVVLFSFILDIKIFLPKIVYLIPYYIPIFLVIIQCIILRINKECRIKNLIIAEKYNNSIITYKNMLEYIEKNKFKSQHIVKLYRELYNGKSASKQISEFSKILEFIVSRRNRIYQILNPILMIDYHLIIFLELWKLKSGDYFEKWINVIAELEALSSLAIIRYDNTYWSMPKFVNGESKIIAQNIGYPLLSEKRVCNSIRVEEPDQVILITGSNMSGKSTFMRTIGINIVLAYAGAPVCADNFYCTIMNLYTCMKISDNLEKSISSFYAEILKIKNIVRASKEGKPIVFLLDEIFKGTNSNDRHTGAMILIDQLCKSGSIGFISTHDIELGEIENVCNSNVKNYHFSEYYKNNKINFDYKLKVGISTTRNAMCLMKLAGIEIEEKDE
ncbi:DNA mismatch repair protein [Clostridium botulinum]|uniref:MutS-related protein n=2 Tax=Clostridium TaxID=1485 RepID=UPI0013CC8AAF|nr:MULTISPECIES: DNA mismatch repair protein [unclassified Clostridium]MBY7009343.1 DNA mismatch repair protein [Clostridium botulinum]NFH73997.1 DNA mismatch repair protein [Clostridium botulinum]NFI02141.1 DNA mismatch repair protein [Clostridium botulinum]NFI64415.1 DNA mismatch repair protein [Clostridium botulinum]NFI82199.1 DNA mismatch repair protein [Clostridium botulinum]